MAIEIRKLDEVWTADDVRLGLAHQLFHRSGDPSPQLRLYATYLQVKNFDFGDAYYVPTDYIAGRDPLTGSVRLTIPFRTVLTETWTRMPQFVLAGLVQREELAESEVAAA
jgi:hypothetical protein